MNDKARKAIAALEEYGHLEGTETGEYWLALTNLAGNFSDYIDKPLERALLDEVRWHLEYVKENATVLCENKTYTEAVRRLEWTDR